MRIAPTSTLLLLGVVFTYASTGESAPDPLADKPLARVAYATFDEAVEKLKDATGLKVSYSEDTAKVTRAVWNPRKHVTSSGPQNTIKQCIENLSSNFALDWTFSPEDKTVDLHLPWRVSDPRSAAELFREIWKPEAVAKMDAEAIWKYRLDAQRSHHPAREAPPRAEAAAQPQLAADATWQPTFNALLSKAGNFERACKVRQRSALEATRFPNTTLLFMEAPALEAEMIDVKGDKYFCVFFDAEFIYSPGHGSLSYYWFREDGTLVGAELMDTGHRCFAPKFTVKNAPPESPMKASELTMTVKWGGNGDQVVARFVLDENGLEFSPDAIGQCEEKFFDDLHLGESLLDP